MTNEMFERAVEIRDIINTIIELQGVLGNVQDNDFEDKYLAAIDAKRFSSSGYVVEECKVLNNVKVPEYILKKFESILWDELSILQEEFKTL